MADLEARSQRRGADQDIVIAFARRRSGWFDHAHILELDLHFGGLSSAEEQAVLSGEDRIAEKAGNGVWEVIGFLVCKGDRAETLADIGFVARAGRHAGRGGERSAGR